MHYVPAAIYAYVVGNNTLEIKVKKNTAEAPGELHEPAVIASKSSTADEFFSSKKKVTKLKKKKK